MRYANLHAHTTYSTRDGYATVEEYVGRLAELGHTHGAVTDHGTMAALPVFWAEARKRGIVPVAGLEAYQSLGPRQERGEATKKAHHLTLLAVNRQGYQNLVALASKANLEGFYYFPRVDRELLARHADGVVCLSGCLAGLLPRHLLAGEEAAAHDLLGFYQEVYGERFFLEFQNHGDLIPEQTRLNRELARLARKHGIRTAATNDSHFCRRHDAPGQRLLLDSGAGQGFHSSPHTWVRDDASMLRAFGDNNLLRNTLEIASWAEAYDLGERFPKLPASPLETGEPGPTTRRLAWSGLCKRLGVDRVEALPTAYRERLAYELEVVRTMGEAMGAPFERYFLVIASICQHLRRSNIPFGPRGSAAGSILCWSLGIGEVDPVAHGLIFERFLNPERVTLPDIDLDIADDRRDEVLAWAKATWGEACVGHIGTYAKIGPKQAIKDVAKLRAGRLAEPYLQVSDRLTRLVPDSGVHDWSLAELLADPGQPLAQAPEQALLAEAVLLDGRFRGTGTHAAGVVVADRPLAEIAPVMRTKEGVLSQQTQYEMGALEGVGLLKVDILGLSELAKLALANAEVGADLWALPTDDPAAWAVVNDLDTQGLFQLGSPGMTRTIAQLAPRTIGELALAQALWRPGPMDNLAAVGRRRRGEEPVVPIHPAVDELLAPTFGFPVYQEQVIGILVRLAGMSRGQADLVRKAMGKKDEALLAAQRQRFLDGAFGQGHNLDQALAVWEYIVPFAGYGFVLSHAVSYAYLAYQGAWLKAHHPLQFYTAALTVEARGAGKKRQETPQDRIGVVAQEARRRGVTLLPPDVTRPTVGFTVEGDAVRYGLAAVKGVGEKAAAAIVRHAPYAGLADLVAKLPAQAVPKGALAALALAGALPWHNRATTLRAVEELAALRAKAHGAPRKGESETACRQRLHARMTAAVRAHPVAAEEERDAVTLLTDELEHLGITRSPWPASTGLPVDGELSELGSFVGERVTVAALAAKVEPFTTRTGKTMARLTLIDGGAVVEALVWPSAWAAGPVPAGQMVLASGRVKPREAGLEVTRPSEVLLGVEHVRVLT